MALDIDKEEMTIMGVAFENRSVFKSVWYALSTNVIEWWRPTVSDVEKLRDEVLALGIAWWSVNVVRGLMTILTRIIYIPIQLLQF